MRKSKFSAVEVASILKEGDSGIEIGELCQRNGISKQTFYRWKSAQISLPQSQLELENHNLKQALAEAMLEVRSLKISISKR